jgi:ribosome-associated protein
MNRTSAAKKIVAVTKQKSEDSDSETLYDGPSKSQKKRESTALQKLGGELVAQPRDRLLRVPMPEILLDAITQAQEISDHEGRRRQMQYVGKLMRSVDVEPIRAALDAWNGTSKAEAAEMHALERWRENLLADDAALSRFAEQHSAALNPDTLRELRSAIRMARKEQSERRPPRHFRELFQILKAVVGHRTPWPNP